MAKIFKVHTDELGRLIACLQKSMYGVSRTAFTQELPSELRSAADGDIVFISERKISGNALFGPLYIVANRQGVVPARKFGSWVEIDVRRSDPKELAYWVDLEKRNYCLLFDKVLSDRISIVWPNDWVRIGLQLPSWGIVTDDNAHKLIDFAISNEQEAQSFFQKHNFW
ncbi:hypothetical protein E4633_14530 [Geomonas terrae]|uniref:Uncharacterized protein n=1 Tax=Geomonas terrae TaxID=2562681 RepID=A0A4S1CET3_9BACT|nr:hypothetical protein [Geomonas terrae]TGU71526.1 hypothetical protein E4633_14530 [Geomonas terrae]